MYLFTNRFWRISAQWNIKRYSTSKEQPGSTNNISPSLLLESFFFVFFLLPISLTQIHKHRTVCSPINSVIFNLRAQLYSEFSFSDTCFHVVDSRSQHAFGEWAGLQKCAYQKLCCESQLKYTSIRKCHLSSHTC